MWIVDRFQPNAVKLIGQVIGHHDDNKKWLFVSTVVSLARTVGPSQCV